MSRGSGKTFRRLALAAYLALVLVGALFAFVVADHAGGRAVAFLSLVGFFVLPIGAGVLVERLAAGRGREIHAERTALVLLPLGAVALVVLTCVYGRRTTSAALTRFPDRHEWSRGWIGEPVRWLGLALRRPEVESSPRPPASGAASATASITSAPADAGELPSESAPSGRFASGDTSYAERDEGCETLADVAKLEGAYVPGARRAAAEGLARARYASGLPFLQAQDDKQLAVWFTNAADSFGGVASRFDAAVHEGAHFWGFKRMLGSTRSYPVRTDLTIETKVLKNFPWSEILARHVDAAGDTYAKTYLEGPSGAQGFNTLLDEYNAYAHSLASRYCTRDLLAPNARVSARDGILTMMYYLETYLSIGRTSHAHDYAAILADPGHRRMILTVWDRAEFWLRKSEGVPALGIKADRIEAWVYAPERLEEIARVRAAK